MGYTTRMLEKGLSLYEEAHTFPVCFIANNMDIALNHLQNTFVRMAVNRGHTVYKHMNRIKLDGGATFLFLSKSNLEIRMMGKLYADILFDNSCE